MQIKKNGNETKESKKTKWMAPHEVRKIELLFLSSSSRKPLVTFRTDGEKARSWNTGSVGWQ